jgi:hypothetical protein
MNRRVMHRDLAGLHIGCHQDARAVRNRSRLTDGKGIVADNAPGCRELENDKYAADEKFLNSHDLSILK